MLTVIFRVLFSLFPSHWSEWKRKWVKVLLAHWSGGNWSPRKAGGVRGRGGAPGGRQPSCPSSFPVPSNSAFRLKKRSREDDAAFLTYHKSRKGFPCNTFHTVIPQTSQLPPRAVRDPIYWRRVGPLGISSFLW